MRSDLKDNTNTINKMIQFGTVKYGIVKQLKDRSRSERDVSSDQEENGTSMPCSPIVECSKSASPVLEQTTILNNSNHHHHHHHHHNSDNIVDEDHNHNNNITVAIDVNNHSQQQQQSILLHPNSPIKSTELIVDTGILPTSYPLLEKLNHKTPSPALAEQNRIADQPQQSSPSLVERIIIPTAITTAYTQQNDHHHNNDDNGGGGGAGDIDDDDDDDDDNIDNNNANGRILNDHINMSESEEELSNKSNEINACEKIDQSNCSTDEKSFTKSIVTTVDDGVCLAATKLTATTDNREEEGEEEEEGDKLMDENSLIKPSKSLDQNYGGGVVMLEQNNSNCNSPPPQMPQFPAGPVTLEAIQNMQMAIAQFAAKTFANGGGEANEAAMKQLAFLQQTLFNLQQQQLFQIQLIQQLQSQLAMNQLKNGADGGVSDDEREDDDDRDEIDDRDCENMGDNDNQSSIRNRSKKLNVNNSVSEILPNSNKRSKTNYKLDNADGDDEDDDDDDDDDIDDDDKDSIIEFKKFRPDEPLEYGEIRPPYQNIDHRIIQNDSQIPPYPKQDENMPLPYGSDLASSIITNHDDVPSSNCLEMLQKRTQEVLDSASQGILSGNLADEFAFGKDRNGDSKNRNEPFFKHRCRYCGKVFGSDSALQIHIRSHTGERPFKCNVCGSRFTTKGNLKVHFQRHAQKFPHVPMNSTPIPEHLDKFHPPLLEQMSPDSSPQHQPQMPPVPNVPVSLALPFPAGAGFPGLQSLYRPPLDILKSLGPYSNPFFSALPSMPPPPPTSQQQQHQQQQPPASPQEQQSDEQQKKKEQEMPTDLRKPSAPNSPTKSRDEEEIKEDPPIIKIKEERCDEDDDELEEEQLSKAKRPRSRTPPRQSLPPPPPQIQPSAPHPPHQHPHQQQSPLHPLMAMPPHHAELPMSSAHLYATFGRDDMPDHHHRMPLNFRISPERRSPNRSPASIASSIPRSPFLGPMKHEMALLPRPHSNDNSWENFIEVSNTSETLKLKELMKNKKLTDPNQCVVCDRVLSCKSALQMHYRTHTGERPFKCRICGRAFTTKGNLKTHMAVHKIRPPMRNFHQCPVCHKKYSNALVLQQHIRLHTGEPTDLTPEQISAAEIRDFPPSMMPGSFLNPFAFNFGMAPQNGHMGSDSSLGELDDNMDCSDDFDDDLSDHDMLSNGGDSDRPKSRDEMKGMHFEQKLKIDNNRIKSETSNSSAPASPVSAIVQSKASPVPSDSTSQGALDLTPRSAIHQTQSAPPPAPPPPPPPPPPQPPQSSPSPIPPIQQQQQQQQQPQHHLQHQPHQQHHPIQHHHHHQQQHQSQIPSPHNHPMSHMMPQRPPFGMFPNIPLFPPVSSSTHNMCTAMNTIAQSVMPSAPFNPLALSGVRGSTTCGICFKTFPCHSALEIHYRSHTKERPFKCSICDRGFTTKGNLKQHMLTHKIRDMEQDAFRNRAIKFEYMRNLKEDFE